MLDGLEVSVVKLSQLKVIETFRIDSDYFLKKYINAHQIVESNKSQFLSFDDLGLKIDASAFYPSLEPYYNQGNVPFVRVADVNDFIDYENCVKIPRTILESLEFKTLKTILNGDIVITKGGSIGRVALITRETAVTRDLIFVNSSKLEEKDFIFLYIYLNTSFCYNLMVQSSSMTAQPHLTLTLIKNLPIFNPNNEFREVVADLFRSAILARETAKQKYMEAETLLLENLGLQDFQADSKPVNIKSLKESFLQTGRLDAEFYQPIYEQLEKFIRGYSTGFEKLGKLCTLHDGNYTPKEDQEYDYIELSNIGKSGEITGSTKALGKDLPSRARRKVRSNQVIISSIEGSLQNCAIVPSYYDNALCSTGFYVLSSDVMNAETLLVLFKSSLMQQILKKNCSGTILTAINKEELLNILLPIISQNIQEKIAEYIRQSNDLHQQAQDLLAQAKNNVEWKIENYNCIENNQWGGKRV